MRVALAQINNTVGDLEANAAKILDFAAKAEKFGADVTVFPELALTGYPPRDLVEKHSFLERTEAVLQSKDFGEASGLLVRVEHPTFGEHVRLKTLIEFSRSETVAEPGCLSGQHTDAILTELGYSADAIADLRTRKIVA